VSNHISSLDDPCTLATLVPIETFLDHRLIRWTLCATDRCFKYPLINPLWHFGKVLPIKRGAGLDQPELQVAAEKLYDGGWLHIFPEGTRSADGQLGSMKIGIGKLVAAPPKPPVVVPFYHRGMDSFMPKGSSIPSLVGNKIDIIVGDPIYFDELIAEYKKNGSDDMIIYKAIATKVGEKLNELKLEMEQLSSETDEYEEREEYKDIRAAFHPGLITPYGENIHLKYDFSNENLYIADVPAETNDIHNTIKSNNDTLLSQEFNDDIDEFFEDINDGLYDYLGEDDYQDLMDTFSATEKERKEDEITPKYNFFSESLSLLNTKLQSSQNLQPNVQ